MGEFEHGETPETTHTTPATDVNPPENSILKGLKDHFEEEEEEGEVTDALADEIEDGLLKGEISEEEMEEAFGDNRPSPEELYHNLQQALRQERAERREAVAEAREQAAQEAYAAFIQTQREQAAQHAAIQAWQQANPPIDVNEDPIGYFNQKFEQQNMVLQAQQQAMATYAQQEQERQQVAHLKSTVEQDEAVFEEQYPDYETNPDGSEGGALGHWRESRAQELAMIYPNASEQDIMNTIYNDEVQYSHHAMQMGVSPAAYFYQMAINRGYVPRQVEDSQEDEDYDLPPRGPDGRFMSTSDDDAELYEEGRRYSQSLSGAGSRREDVSIERMLQLDGPDFERAWKTMKKSKANPLFR